MNQKFKPYTFARKTTGMIRIGIVREGKTPQDNRVPFSPKQCAELQQLYPEIQFVVQPSDIRCFHNDEYIQQGILLQEDVSGCDYLFGVKEALVETLIPNKTYFFFSHTKKAQAHNKKLMRALIANQIRMVDYECLVHEDGHRIVGFGFWAGVVGAHNGLLTYGKKFNTHALAPVHTFKNVEALKESYEGLVLPPVKIAVTGSGRVASGVLDILQYLDIAEVNNHDFLNKTFPYPVYVHLTGEELYARMDDSTYNRDDFHKHADAYCSLFLQYAKRADILMNGIYWDHKIPRLFELEHIANPEFKLPVIADITCDENGSVPCNLGASTIEDSVYGFNRATGQRDLPFQPTTEVLDIMAVDNLPNELPRDASKYFGGYLMRYVIPELIQPQDQRIIDRATICQEGKLTEAFSYLEEYAFG
jgi:saccharopine dehydrogenase (NAD+, L-lysine-forming)